MSLKRCIICPISPDSSDPVPAEESGWADLESAPIAAEVSSDPKAASREDADDVVDDGGDAVQLPRGIPPPPEPTAEEVAQVSETQIQG